MVPESHPSYPHPTIQEAICEIIFDLPQDKPWNPLLFGEYFKSVQGDYASFEPVNVPGLQLQFGFGVQDTPPPPPSQIVRYRHAKHPAMIQQSERSIAVTRMPEYPGWETMLEDIEYAFEHLISVVCPERVVRIGLRYINRIERSHPEENLSAWFSPSDYIPEYLLQSKSGFFSMTHTKMDDNNRLNIIIGEQSGPQPSAPAFIFDIDRLLENELPPEMDKLVVEINQMHDDVWNVFNKVKNDKLVRLLNGEI